MAKQVKKDVKNRNIFDHRVISQDHRVISQVEETSTLFLSLLLTLLNNAIFGISYKILKLISRDF